MTATITVREQRIARVIDREVAPYWHDRFARLLFRHLPTATNAVALDIHCGPGHTTAELLTRLDDTSRVVALEPQAAQIALAKARVRPEWKDRVYFKTGDLSDVADMGENAYDITVANLVLAEAHDWKGVVAELLRITKPGGSILATLPLRGTWAEVEDLFYEILLTEGLEGAVRRLGRLAEMRPLGTALAQGLQELGVSADDFVIEQERFSLLFPSGREFLFTPLIEHGPLRLWKAIIGEGGNPQELFWHLKEAIDTYYAGHVFSVTVAAGLILIRAGAEPGRSVAREYWRHYPELDSLWQTPVVGLQHAEAPDEAELDAVQDLDSGVDIDVDLDVDVDLEAHSEPTSVSAATPRDEPNTDDQAILDALDYRRAPAPDDDDELERVLERVFELGNTEMATRANSPTSPRLPPPPATGPHRVVSPPPPATGPHRVASPSPPSVAHTRQEVEPPHESPDEPDPSGESVQELSIDDIIDDDFVLDPDGDITSASRDDFSIDDIIDEYLQANRSADPSGAFVIPDGDDPNEDSADPSHTDKVRQDDSDGDR